MIPIFTGTLNLNNEPRRLELQAMEDRMYGANERRGGVPRHRITIQAVTPQAVTILMDGRVWNMIPAWTPEFPVHTGYMVRNMPQGVRP
jgi:hypothetical protein